MDGIYADGPIVPRTDAGAVISDKVDIQLPQQLPLTLRHSEFAFSTVAAVAGIAMGLITSAVISALATGQQSWAQLFVLDGAEALIPIAMLCMFFWGLAICALRSARIGKLLHLSSRAALHELDRIASNPSVDLSALAAALRSPSASASPLHRRVHAVVQQWQLHADLSAALALVDQHAIADEDTVRRGYGTLKTFVWALPVLGLIGTVFGIASAVGEFSTFLGTEVEDVTTIKKALVGVTGGLAFAFAITIVGLVASLLLMLPSSALQAKEERFYGGLQGQICDVFLPTLQRRYPVQAAAPSPSDGFREAMIEVGREVIRSVGAMLAQTSQAIAGSMSNSLAPSLASNEKIATGLIGEMAALRQAGSAALQAHQGALDKHVSHLAAIRDGLGSVLEKQAAAVAAVSDQMSRLAESNVRILEGQRALTGGLATLQPLPAALMETAAAISRLSTQHASSETTTQSLVANTERMLEAQRALAAAMTQLDGVGLGRSLAALSQSMEKVSAVLQGFQEPMVLQAVPARTVPARTP